MRNPYRNRGNKYGRKKVDIDGHVFDSKLEAAIFTMLKLDQNTDDIILQDKVYLTKAKILAKIDFKVIALDGSEKWVEAKGRDLPLWNIKKRLWKHYGPGTLEIWKGSHTKFYLDSVVESGAI